MGNSIGRKRTLGIAVEGTYGTPASSATFVLPVLDVPRFELVQNKVRNTASMGSSYQTNNLMNTTSMVKFSMPVKVDEDQLPVFFKQKFTFASTTISGETTCYQHILTYSNTNYGTSYTLFFEDSDRTGSIISGVKFGKLNLVCDPKEYLKLEIEGVGKSPTTWTGTNTVTAPNEFVGKHATFNYGTYGGAKSAFSTLKATFSHNFNLSGDDTNFALGSAEMVNVATGEDDFSGAITALMPDFTTIRTDYSTNVLEQFDVTITDTSRSITGSVATTRPYIQFSYPAGYVEGWAEAGGAGDVLKQELTLTPIDKIGVATCPLTITVKNHVATY